MKIKNKLFISFLIFISIFFSSYAANDYTECDESKLRFDNYSNLTKTYFNRVINLADSVLERYDSMYTSSYKTNKINTILERITLLKTQRDLTPGQEEIVDLLGNKFICSLNDSTDDSESTSDVNTDTWTSQESVSTTPDTIPEAFTFSNLTNQPQNLDVETSVIVNGINTATQISISGWEYSINNWEWTTSEWMVNNGDIVKVKHKTSWRNSRTVSTTVTIGWISATFSSTTACHSQQWQSCTVNGIWTCDLKTIYYDGSCSASIINVEVFKDRMASDKDRSWEVRYNYCNDSSEPRKTLVDNCRVHTPSYIWIRQCDGSCSKTSEISQSSTNTSTSWTVHVQSQWFAKVVEYFKCNWQWWWDRKLNFFDEDAWNSRSDNSIDWDRLSNISCTQSYCSKPERYLCNGDRIIESSSKTYTELPKNTATVKASKNSISGTESIVTFYWYLPSSCTLKHSSLKSSGWQWLYWDFSKTHLMEAWSYFRVTCGSQTYNFDY